MYQLYWGDLHDHCSISYGHGTVRQALARARQQLDFCSVTGHAFWPDMPSDRQKYAEIIDYHTTGFARLARNWNKLLEQQREACQEGKFVVLPSYEWHSCKYGDHNVYAAGADLELQGAADLPELRAKCKAAGAIAIPHHIGYAAGYRGIDWQHFREDCSPFVEIFSLHGCSESDGAPFPMLHDMGPRDAGSTAEAGWALGHRFGIIGSTDHHSAYPGSHGDGRLGVFAKALTRAGLWEAFLARRVFAATGDKIDAQLLLNDAWIGSSISAPGTRRLQISVQGMDALDRVEVLKNGRLLARFFPTPAADSGEYRLRIAWGWGRKTVPVEWLASLKLSEGSLLAVDSCFSGPPVVAPLEQHNDEEVADAEDLPHEVLEWNGQSVAWRSTTTGNLSMRHATTQELSLKVRAPLSAMVTVEVNGQRYQHPLAELLQAGRSHFLRGWLSEAIRIGPLVPMAECCVMAEMEDEPERDVDYYRLRVAQTNNHWAWLSPIWTER